MTFAPAVAVACLQVLGWICLFVAGLCVAILLKQLVAPAASIDLRAIAMLAAVFGLGGLGSLRGASVLRRATGA